MVSREAASSINALLGDLGDADSRKEDPHDTTGEGLKL